MIDSNTKIKLSKLKINKFIEILDLRQVLKMKLAPVLSLIQPVLYPENNQLFKYHTIIWLENLKSALLYNNKPYKILEYDELYNQFDDSKKTLLH